MSRNATIFLYQKKKYQAIINPQKNKEPYINEKKKQDWENVHFIVNVIRSMILDKVECLPTWAACRSFVSKAQTPLMHVGFL